MRLNAWNTTPTVLRRYSASAFPRSPTISVSQPDRSAVGVSSPASTESSVVLPQPLAPSSSTSWPSLDVEVEPVDRPHA